MELKEYESEINQKYKGVLQIRISDANIFYSDLKENVATVIDFRAGRWLKTYTLDVPVSFYYTKNFKRLVDTMIRRFLTMIECQEA